MSRKGTRQPNWSLIDLSLLQNTVNKRNTEVDLIHPSTISLNISKNV